MTTPVPEPQLDELYRELILDHYRSPRNKGKLDHATVEAEGYNPVCGDEIQVWLEIENGKVKDAHFEGRGCSISQASGSMMTEALKGRSVGEVRELAQAFTQMMTDPETEPPAELGDLEAFQGVAKFAVRVKCATLAWRTAEEALAGRNRSAQEEKGPQ
jgi:nitrogen fixation protein NifU and related proteins